MSLIIGFVEETIEDDADANSLNLSFGTESFITLKLFFKVFFILFVDFVLVVAACTPLPRIIS